jgi:hypothetical protein
MQGKTKAEEVLLADNPMQSPYSDRGNVLQPIVSLTKGCPTLSQIQVPFEYVPPTATKSGSCSSTKYS